jgi:hypothetical protein
MFSQQLVQSKRNKLELSIVDLLMLQNQKKLWMHLPIF